MNDYAWNNASAIERCEVLRERLDRIESAKGERVKVMVHPDGSFSAMPGGITMVPPGFLTGEQVTVPAVELARLRRIEEAARALQDGSDRYEFLAAPRMAMKLRWDALRAALVSEPTR